MYVTQQVTECDFYDRHYDSPVAGAGVIAQGATGRWCVVMWMGPEYIRDNNIEVTDIDEAREQIDASGNGWADF